jgi:hypothetical protein
MKARFLLGFLILIVLIESCTSGKSAYKHGDYYTAVLEAVQRLRQSPDNKRSKSVLSLSYQAAVDFLNTDVQNQITSNANFKWKNVVQDYNRVNTLYENIRTSPGALKIIPNPINKYKELNVAKDSAAAECYNRGVEAMLKNTREDAKQAFFLFTDANAFSPAYRESIEMMQQAKFNATLKVVVQPSVQNYWSWNFDPVVFGGTGNQFVQFYTPEQAQSENLEKIDQFLLVSVHGFQENRPAISRTVQNYSDSVKVGEKTVNNQKVPVKERITAQMTVFEKIIPYSGALQLFIKDARSNVQLSNTRISSELSWNNSWAACTGDSRCIPSGVRGLCNGSESHPATGQLVNLAKKDLDGKLAYALTNFYRNY